MFYELKLKESNKILFIEAQKEAQSLFLNARAQYKLLGPLTDGKEHDDLLNKCGFFHRLARLFSFFQDKPTIQFDSRVFKSLCIDYLDHGTDIDKWLNAFSQRSYTPLQHKQNSKPKPKPNYQKMAILNSYDLSVKNSQNDLDNIEIKENINPQSNFPSF